MANEWAKQNINVNAIAPGYMATNNMKIRADEQRSAEILDRIPAGRWGLPSDLMGPNSVPCLQRFRLCEWLYHCRGWRLAGALIHSSYSL
ncbi:SDR family oxidoreductase [Escherichia coli]